MVFLKYDGCDPIDSETGGFATIPGDADIGGAGVMIAFIITAWITILASTMASLREWNMLKPRFVRFALGAEDLLGPLCDLQAITGAAILIAGFSQWQTITYYHRELVGLYWNLTANSFWSARRAYMYDADPISKTSTDMAPPGTNHTDATRIKRPESYDVWTVWRVYTRRVFIVISVALGIAWSTSSIILEIHGWDEQDPNRCYNYNDATYNNQGKYYNGVMLVGLFFYFVSLLLTFVDRDGKVVAKYNSWSESVLEVVTKRHGGFNTSDSQSWPAHLWGVAYWVARLIRAIIAVWSYGDTQSPEFFLFYYVFVSWNTWDIVMLKVLNERLVDDEMKIGFGQVLPLVLLVQIGLNIVDIWKDPSKATERKQHSVKKKTQNSVGYDMELSENVAKPKPAHNMASCYI